MTCAAYPHSSEYAEWRRRPAHDSHPAFGEFGTQVVGSGAIPEKAQQAPGRPCKPSGAKAAPSMRVDSARGHEAVSRRAGQRVA
ncbi:hypothetical protein [Streptomyces sp. 7N604]|uniref:hypothetical protein n=1 Tax=Streptomyces sp. 7N604 TaxID=3457415 RepID=UPI003FD1E4B9